MKSIEFIGPSGIGKSTFLNHFSDYFPENFKWIAKRNALKEINRIPVTLTRRLLSKTGLVARPERSVNRNELFQLYNKEIGLLTDLFYNHLFERELAAYQKIRLTNYYFNTIIYHLLYLRHQFTSNKVVILDEGLIVNGGFAYLKKKPSYFMQLTQSAIFPSGVVYFTIDDTIYKERMYKRFEETGENRLNPIKKIIDLEKIDEYISNQKELTIKEMVLCKQLKIPVLELKAECNVENYQTLKEFINLIYNSE